MSAFGTVGAGHGGLGSRKPAGSARDPAAHMENHPGANRAAVPDAEFSRERGMAGEQDRL